MKRCFIYRLIATILFSCEKNDIDDPVTIESFRF